MRLVQAWLCTRAHRQRVGGTWYYVADQSMGWPTRGWTQRPDEHDDIIRTEIYEPEPELQYSAHA